MLTLPCASPHWSQASRQALLLSHGPSRYLQAHVASSSTPQVHADSIRTPYADSIRTPYGGSIRTPYADSMRTPDADSMRTPDAVYGLNI